jgi:hypothetical protein
MTIAWYDPTNQHVSTDKGDPLFTPLGQVWPLDREREWVGLTQTQVKLLREGVEKESIKTGDSIDWVFYTHINEALKEKNS